MSLSGALASQHIQSVPQLRREPVGVTPQLVGHDERRMRTRHDDTRQRLGVRQVASFFSGVGDWLGVDLDDNVDPRGEVEKSSCRNIPNTPKSTWGRRSCSSSSFFLALPFLLTCIIATLEDVIFLYFVFALLPGIRWWCFFFFRVLSDLFFYLSTSTLFGSFDATRKKVTSDICRLRACARVYK